MALTDSLEKNGNILFKYRGQIPAMIFLIALPFIYFTDYRFFLDQSESSQKVISLIVLISSILVSLTGFCIRAYTIGTTPRGTSGRNTDKQVAKVLNTNGIYSVVRHPLYLGNYLMWAGLLLFTMNIPLMIIISLLYWLYYERIMYAEEAFLTRQFGDDFLSWSRKVPAFLPKWKNFKKSDIPFSMKAVLRREYSGFFSIILAFTIVDYGLQFTFCQKYLPLGSECSWFRPSLIVLLSAFVIMLILRTLKHHTKLLNPDQTRD